MLSTMPRRIASSATSCCDHWVIGRSLADGGSQAMAMMAQICSAPNLAGAPLFGASDRRAATATPGALDSQRLCHRRTVFGHTPRRRAISRTPTPSSQCRIMRARNAICCGVVWPRVRPSRARRSSSPSTIGTADK